MRESRWGADAALLGVAVIWGFNFPVMKVALFELHPFAFNSVRITLSALVLGLLHLRERPAAPVPREMWRAIVGLSLIGYFVYQIFFLLGLANTTAGSSSLLLASSPIWTALVMRCRGEYLPRMAWTGLALAFTGTGIIASVRGDIELAGASVLGNVLTIGAAMAWGTYTALNRRAAMALPATTLAFYTTAVTLPLHWMLAVPYYGQLTAVQDPFAVWGAVVYAGVLGTGVAYALWNVGIRHVGAAHTAVYTNLAPVIAVIAGCLWLGEVIQATHVVGGVLILGGLWVMRRSRRLP